MIFVVFFVPVAVYLLVLGWINRRPRPLIISGTWDAVGILFAASGFLLCGGPAVLSSLNDHWRLFWLLGEGGSLEGLQHAGQLSVVLSVVYFLLVVAGAALLFGQHRRLTSIYNVEPSSVEDALLDVCEALGLEPVRSGTLFVFGLSLGEPTHKASPEGIQAPHWRTQTGKPAFKGAIPEDASPGEEFLGQNAILEVESFPAGKHVTLRWDPCDSPLRAVLEGELDRRLGRTGAPYHDTGTWLSLAGYVLLATSLLIVVGLMLRTLFVR